VRSLSAPIWDGTGRVAAAINVSAHASRWTLEAMRGRLLPQLLETARALNHDTRAGTRL
jgi:IclR family transcriptional regulator, pca regulon regulatory protein